MISKVTEVEKELIQLEKDWATIEKQIAFLENLKEAYKQKIIETFNKAYGYQSAKFVSPETGGVLKRIISVRIDWDDEIVRGILRKEEWDIIKKEIVDREKMKNAIQAGLINPVLLNKAVKQQTIEKIVHEGGKNGR